ncbi:helix-turn-helix domain-containing protein [Domibacillus robiginosus]|uniref:helix-turn-helix domain-containing protein n=1 Tax=Domibacillus robiginosus TaxID=1071054 RepID=UPI00067C96DC|nr:helix-turn-helix transcriptional regulator [Domibacillus robiginosus]
MIGYGEKLKELRLENNLTMGDAARIVSIAKSTYAGYESEFRQPSLEKITLFAHYYNVSVDYILCLTDQRERKDLNEGFNAKNLLSEELHWDGIPLNEEELKHMNEFLKTIEERNKKSKTSKKFG